MVCHQPWPLALFGPVAKRHSVPLVLWMHMAASRHWLDRLAWRVMARYLVCNSRFTASTLPESNARVKVVYVPVDTSAARRGQARGQRPRRHHSGQQDGAVQGARRASGCAWPAARAGRMDVLACRWSAARARGAVHGVASRARGRAGDRRSSRVSRRAIRRSAPSRRLRYLLPAQRRARAFGISLIEALAAGLPVVTSALGGAKEIVDETCGVLVAPRDSATLASALSALLDDRARRERLGSSARRERGRCATRPRRCRVSPRFSQEAAAIDADEDRRHQLQVADRRREARRHRARGAPACRWSCASRPRCFCVFSDPRPAGAAYDVRALPWKSFVDTWAGLRMTAGYLGNLLALQVDVREFDAVIAHGDSLLLSMGRKPSFASCTAARSAKQACDVDRPGGSAVWRVSSGIADRAHYRLRASSGSAPTRSAIIPSCGNHPARRRHAIFHPSPIGKSPHPSIVFVGAI